MAGNWDGLRDMFLEGYPGVRRRWQARYADLIESGMDDADAKDAADDFAGISPNDERVTKWMARTGLVPDDGGAAPAGPDESGGATDVKNVRWVAENLSNPSVTPSSAPSLSAWNMLVFARTNPTQTAKFWSDLYKPIMLPAKKDLENTSRDLEDEERLMHIIDQVQKMAEEAGQS